MFLSWWGMNKVQIQQAEVWKGEARLQSNQCSAGERHNPQVTEHRLKKNPGITREGIQPPNLQRRKSLPPHATPRCKYGLKFLSRSPGTRMSRRASPTPPPRWARQPGKPGSSPASPPRPSKTSPSPRSPTRRHLWLPWFSSQHLLAKTKPRLKLSLLASGADPLLGSGTSRAGRWLRCAAGAGEGLSPWQRPKGRDGGGARSPLPTQTQPRDPSPPAPGSHNRSCESQGRAGRWRNGRKEPLTPGERRIISNNTPKKKKIT